MKILLLILLFALSLLPVLADSKDRFQVDTESGAIIIKHFDLYTNCSSKYIANVSIEKNKIIVTELDVSSQKSKCNCYIDMDININQVSSGDYKLIIVRDEYKKYGYSKDTSYQIYNGEVKVKGSSSRLQPAITFEQSDCKNLQSKPSNNKSLGNDILVFPNPASSSFSLNFELAKDGDITIQIYNFLGKQVASFQRNGLSNGANTIVLSAKDLQPGMYIGKFITSNGRVNTFRLTWSK